MTLADFLKVFDFEHFILNIVYFGDKESHTYFWKNEVERDYCTLIYTVLSVRPVDESTIRVIIWQ